MRWCHIGGARRDSHPCCGELVGHVLVTPWFSIASCCRARSTGRDSVLSCCVVRLSDACQGDSGARREAAAWPGCGVVCVVCFCGGSVSPFAGLEAGARLSCTAVLAWLCLAPVGVVGLALGRHVLLVVPASSGCRDALPHRIRVGVVAPFPVAMVSRWPVAARQCLWVPRFRGPILGFQPVMAPACVASRPGGVSGFRGGSTCGPSTL
ncbi:hypothetical protein Taro_044768 [Colocasia esculenta]|uniref:Uncharacterized protein n=1 Tax=Colocasia esculenta TaxID=4460 RepID=A0A843WPI9_COLES|nr:hypothetical protein [Colocasia esculenta]